MITSFVFSVHDNHDDDANNDSEVCVQFFPRYCARNSHHTCRNKYTYKGTKDHTVSGLKCKRWDSHFLSTTVNLSASNFPNFDKHHNFCRNPDGDEGPWCFTYDSATPWENCFEDCNYESQHLNFKSSPYILLKVGYTFYRILSEYINMFEECLEKDE